MKKACPTRSDMFRPGNTVWYGIATFVHQVLAHEPLMALGSGHQPRCFFNIIADVVDALVACTSSERTAAEIFGYVGEQ